MFNQVYPVQYGMQFEISQIIGRDMKPTGRYELKIQGDMYHKARALIYDEFIADELATQLKIKVWKRESKHKEKSVNQ